MCDNDINESAGWPVIGKQAFVVFHYHIGGIYLANYMRPNVIYVDEVSSVLFILVCVLLLLACKLQLTHWPLGNLNEILDT